MLYEEYEPCRKLRAFIKCFWTLENDYSRPPGSDGERVWPDGHYELILSSGEPYVQHTSTGARRLPQRFLIGLHTRPLLLSSRGVTRILAVRFHAWGLAPFLKSAGNVDAPSLALSALSNRLVNADSLFDSSRDYRFNHQAHSELERALSHHARNLDGESAVARMGREILESVGSVCVGDLAASHGLSVRQVQRIFARDVGVSPKTLAKIVRFDHARRLINDRPDLSLTAIAHECGYYDHPHFVKNFRYLFGITPKDHRSRVNAARAELGDS